MWSLLKCSENCTRNILVLWYHEASGKIELKLIILLVFLRKFRSWSIFYPKLPNRIVGWFFANPKSLAASSLKNYHETAKNGPIIYSPAEFGEITPLIRLATVIYGAHEPPKGNRHMTQLLIHRTNPITIGRPHNWRTSPSNANSKVV